MAGLVPAIQRDGVGSATRSGTRCSDAKATARILGLHPGQPSQWNTLHGRDERPCSSRLGTPRRIGSRLHLSVWGQNPRLVRGLSIHQRRRSERESHQVLAAAVENQPHREGQSQLGRSFRTHPLTEPRRPLDARDKPGHDRAVEGTVFQSRWVADPRSRRQHRLRRSNLANELRGGANVRSGSIPSTIGALS